MLGRTRRRRAAGAAAGAAARAPRTRHPPAPALCRHSAGSRAGGAAGDSFQIASCGNGQITHRHGIMIHGTHNTYDIPPCGHANSYILRYWNVCVEHSLESRLSTSW